jgi:Ni,Fe-hydrogenase I cytochrome b subunit
MSRIESHSEPREFDRVIRFLHWLNAFAVAMTFALALSVQFATSGPEATAAIAKQWPRACRRNCPQYPRITTD